MADWQKRLKSDPLPALLSSKSEAVRYFTQRDLLNQEVDSVEKLWKLREVGRIINTQLQNGAWKYQGGNEKLRSREDYDQLETYRRLGLLVEKFGLNRKHTAVTSAAHYLFSRQTDDGDFRGIYGHQYSPNYTAGIMELLIKAGYGSDLRIDKAFDWLLSIRQNDGGWAIPARTVGAKWPNSFLLKSETMQGDRSEPFSHLVTGIVLRAFAAHMKFRKSDEARTAGKLLASRFFKRDVYPDRQAADFWTKFSFPFWFTDLLSSLDSLSLIGFARDESNVRRALDWLIARQGRTGTWKLSLLRTGDKDLTLWLSLAICRLIRRLYS